jgi:predicted dehydrogenase
MSDHVRIAFIGCGGNARGHMRSTHNLEGSEVAAVCDLVAELADQAAAEFVSTPYTDLNRMLDEVEPDGVVISIPVHTHGAPEKACLERGIPFLVEKPVARTMSVAREIEAMVAERNLLTAVGYQLRYSETVDAAREVLEGQPICLAAGTYWCGTGRLPGERWTVQFQKSGGQLLEQATHTVDMMRYLVGEIEEVHSYSNSVVLHHMDSPDVNVVSWKYANGALGSLTTTWALDDSDWRFANQVHLTGDALHLHWTSGKLLVKRGADPVEEISGGGPTIDEMFHRAIREDNPGLIRSPYADGVKSLAVSLAALESAATGKVVRPDELR